MSLHRFSYSPLTAGDHKVGLAGSFSAWQILPMENTGGVYILSLELPLGCYRYKFIVDGNWIIDESNPHKESDAFGGLNSVLIVEEAREKLRWDDVIPRLANKAPTDYLKLYRSGEDAGELRFIWFPGLADEILLHVDSQVVSLSRIGGNTLHDVYFCLIRFLHRDVSSDSMDSLYSNQLTIYNDGKGEFSQNLLISITLEILFQGKRLVMDYSGFS
ncbi:MAG: glycogen-binding domain-containing protein, partial [Candidatus Cloacimonetes bacterium]|nr:glycogen-binding domain-containing protein [Candidatus Cloacimonadota bacterium]